MAVSIQCRSVTDQQLDVNKKVLSICVFGLQVNDLTIKVLSETKCLLPYSSSFYVGC